MPICFSVRAGFAALFTGIFALSANADSLLDRSPFADRIGERESSFLALDLATGQRCILEGSDLETRHAPWSTFKIPNTLIALDTGVADNIDAWRDWNSDLRPAQGYWPDAWRQGQTLGTAFQRSAVWYFQDIALEVGTSRYRETLGAWDYGNAEVPDGSDSFWLSGPLKLSVTEQVRFLERLLGHELDVDRASLADLMEIAKAGPIGTATLYGKTGSGPARTGVLSRAFEGWYAGWLMRDDAVSVVFAHHAFGESFTAIRTFRRDFAETLLTACGFTGDPS
ncbi:penicillin-binding transpeptidase domain-containing protein [uncultured Tateyamaria sp.]|uniref:penicillin-binding transpeptidase domain-containing protein n=1 Tax=uncultured Tateyamaria sp. TaxID=455651 RepID=UPI002635468A|nr:penicillin-binding transpeptidase domain-containing protein [uncultured Tateyamaria sp.]